ncbi:UNVERIFIED_CONTAM: hypothetical protein Slati_4571300 [Sesamum latifolium]|uniref:Uncharacterized protein n=1 Tax=Sesamum latifolium TaxID=2727402 RepID=A0AAW2SG03_9LAMI
MNEEYDTHVGAGLLVPKPQSCVRYKVTSESVENRAISDATRYCVLGHLSDVEE